jgi:hypothetical protein
MTGEMESPEHQRTQTKGLADAVTVKWWVSHAMTASKMPNDLTLVSRSRGSAMLLGSCRNLEMTVLLLKGGFAAEFGGMEASAKVMVG